MYANLSFADLEGGLILISADDGTIGFFLVKLKYFLVEIIEGVKKKKSGKNKSTKVFQALRIFVNKEMSELIYGLIAATKVLKKMVY